MSNDLRTAAQQALYALKAMQSYASDMKAGLRICDESIDQLYAALSLKQAEPVVTEPIATVCRESGLQQIEFHTYVPEGETWRLYAMPPMQPAASLMTNIESGDVELVWNDDGFSKTMWRETVLYKIGGGNE